jgi:serine/threonine protein kinase
MEYCLGGELFTLMKKNSKLPEEHCKFYFCEISLALDYLHNKLSIVYRDLKPENILIDSSGHIKLCMFNSFILY